MAVAAAAYLGWSGQWLAGGRAAAPEPGPGPEPAAEAPAAGPPVRPRPEVVVPEPAVQVTVEPYAIATGELGSVRVRYAPGPVSAELAGLAPLRFFVRGTDQVALLAVPAAWEPGTRTLTVRWEGGEWQGTVEVQHRPFPEDRITVSQQQASLPEDPRVAEQQARLRRLRSEGMAEPAWSAEFLLPVRGRQTTAFGEIRYINGRRSGQHSGLDLAAPTGTPVLATNRGKVALAEELVLTGFTVLIDHGGGLFSSYAHLSALSVSAGQWVGRGEEIGQVGSTGLSTGPHLHWSTLVENTYFDPLLLAGHRLLAPRLPTGHQP